jgi:hypothetical protein
MGTLLRRRLQFVNASQLVKFARPIAMFSRVRVETAIVFADEKCAYFSHMLFLGDQQHAEVLVKMKFKKGSLTVPPGEIIGQRFTVKPPHLEERRRRTSIAGNGLHGEKTIGGRNDMNPVADHPPSGPHISDAQTIVRRNVHGRRLARCDLPLAVQPKILGELFRGRGNELSIRVITWR